MNVARAIARRSLRGPVRKALLEIGRARRGDAAGRARRTSARSPIPTRCTIARAAAARCARTATTDQYSIASLTVPRRLAVAWRRRSLGEPPSPIEQRIRRIELHDERHAIEPQTAAPGASSRTASLSVVNTASAPARFHLRVDRREIVRGVAMMIGKRHRVDDVPPGIRAAIERIAIRMRNAGNRQQPLAPMARRPDRPDRLVGPIATGSPRFRATPHDCEMPSAHASDVAAPAVASVTTRKCARAAASHRLAQPAHRHHPAIRNLTNRRHQHVQVSRQLDVLKAIVEDVDRAAELLLGERAGQIAIGRHAHDRAAAPAAPASAAHRRPDRSRRGCACRPTRPPRRRPHRRARSRG